METRNTEAVNRGATARLYVSLVATLLFFVVSGIVSYLNTSTLTNNALLVTHTHEVLTALSDVLSLMKDAETGQRGYVITGDTAYLEPYASAGTQIEERLNDLQKLIRDNPAQQARLSTLRARIKVKQEELKNSLSIREKDGFEPAREAILSDRGKMAMDAIRAQVEEMRDEERDLRRARLLEMDNASRVAIGSDLLTCLFGIVVSGVVAYLLHRGLKMQQRQDWLQSAQIGLSLLMTGEQKLNTLGESILRYLAECLHAQAGAIFIKDGGFKRAATFGVPADGVLEKFDQGEGLLWQAVQDQRTFIVNEIPDNYLTVGSALGRGKPRHLFISPVIEDGEVNAVIELGFLSPPDDSVPALFERVSESVGSAIQSVNYRTHLQNLLEETQRQSEELQAQSEELRVSNEELEEQGRALRESQARLENQQYELEQTNSQLEEQTQLLEIQRDEATQAKASLQVQAIRLKQASQYKSDFLANMSHELRTPLNSSLILAKLLADNPAGNLTDEQVQYAETIRSSGNDLLSLINDILDLSKIEAGHMEVHPEQVRISQLLNDLARMFKPIADQRSLDLQIKIADDCPDLFETDQQRVEQILKNLVSNALKFTEKGSVELSVRRVSDQWIAFAVKDTGIGISPENQQLVFEAFQQVEGASTRKYGGTGLGLSISRELTRLLGGKLSLESKSGEGSIFTVTLPATYDRASIVVREEEESVEAIAKTGSTFVAIVADDDKVPSAAEAKATSVRTARMKDDREHLTGNKRVILVVEDDQSFAGILYDLAHELDFQCLIANTAEEGVAIAIQHLPHAVLLDVGLPDNSGLSVLDRLKNDRRTRHIPVHVVSAGDYAQTALTLGAVGYLLKPVNREELIAALKQLESRLSQRMRRVLVVEDDAVQLDSLRKLLSSHDVTTVGARSGAECLEQLSNATFDCMVLDLTLPDATGFSLLETLSREDAYAFPPVIVYTGRNLSLDEEQRLRRYSKSIIIKGAKSPERLLDEVTLFLHQVVSELPPEQQRMLEVARSRDAAIEGRRILIVEDDVRNIFALTSILEPRGAVIQISRNGREALEALEKSLETPVDRIDLVLMDVMMPEMDGITAMREIRKRPEWKKLPVIMLTAKAMKDDQENCLSAGANDYMPKPLDVDKLLSLVRVWMPR